MSTIRYVNALNAINVPIDADELAYDRSNFFYEKFYILLVERQSLKAL